MLQGTVYCICILYEITNLNLSNNVSDGSVPTIFSPGLMTSVPLYHSLLLMRHTSDWFRNIKHILNAIFSRTETLHLYVSDGYKWNTKMHSIRKIVWIERSMQSISCDSKILWAKCSSKVWDRDACDTTPPGSNTLFQIL